MKNILKVIHSNMKPKKKYIKTKKQYISNNREQEFVAFKN